ncbi:type I polyketide synthase [Actinophytocola algeriensis]|uniref:6-deoxyerythronolide-B synthase n=1 Tax=Actinophytocola algeriensis TaxID=1768010 RepID=A0A7W7QDZ3_9PSEU|nr:type I polyketide synthase [Actinophytocola algeriensis]MBB4911539.1 KS-AT-KR-ACP domain-containing polyene macrolide polyketide synthase/pimaricinolide synthase PimS2/candicidin polyketide synthase FscD [Actinophytocola algeriensis]MBE1473473.1 KS-AT-KR-ACP domain-containing polyene macrolide polyketide synthase/pimaricinolide synthase PimS2/candicidin polyketide synthase FscD [Actinophytocola algeriensis]
MVSGDNEERLRAYLKRASADLRRTRSRLQDLESAAHEPIAIVGMSCRYPGGATSPEDLWRMLEAGEHGITPLPVDRGWRTEEPDSGLAGGFLPDATTFDADFFGISPREALAMDPQQRVLLESTWEAVERARIDPLSLKGTRTGVFVGAIPQDYRVGPPDNVEGFGLTGTTSSVLSGRLAYVLGLVGPVLTVDTACSSSLVAIHLAMRALRAGECPLAVAAGVTVLPTPLAFVEFGKQGGLAADGFCRSFADSASGTGWAEGVGVLVLERLSDARRNDHRVLAVLRGSAVNSDGSSNGLTAPNGPSQERVIEQALVDARLSADQVDVVDAHGTGTVLGDPVEAEALLATYGRDRDPERPLLLGSVKSNLGHTQAAAGVAGVIKMVMAMRHGVLPKTLHVDRPTSHVDWSAGTVRLLTENAAWPGTGEPRRAGVSSFGLSGTNAHVIVEEAVEEPAAREDAVEAGPVPLLVSARSREALRAQAELLRSTVDGQPDLALVDVAHSLATTRARLEHRAVVVADDRDAALAGLSALADGRAEGTVVRGTPQLAVLFAGQGTQRVGLGRALCGRFPVFAAALDAVIAALDTHLDRPLRPVLWGADPDELARTEFAQPALFAVETALYRLVESWGITPDFLAGHSIGEITAAHVAGVFTLDDAAALIAARGRLMQALPPGGAMVAVEAAESEVAPLLAGLADRVAIAAVNGPRAVVLSGDEDVVTELAARFDRARRLTVSHAFHSPHMAPVLDEFRRVVAGLAPGEPLIPIVSTVTGEPATVAELTSPDHWVEHVRATVRFADAVAWLRGHDVTAFLELGPDGTLTALTRACLGDEDLPVHPALRADRDERAAVTAAAAALHVAGVPVRWDTYFTGASTVDLPVYPFQRTRFWPTNGVGGAGDLRAAGLGAAHHPLLSAAVSLAGSDGTLLTGRLSLAAQPWLADHVVAGTALLPGAAMVELAIRAGDEVGCDRLAELTMTAPLPLPAHGGVQVQVWVSEPDGKGERTLDIYARPDDTDDHPWTRHATGVLASGPAVGEWPQPGDRVAEEGPAAGVWPPSGAEALDVTGLYDRLAEQGLTYGPAFRGLTAAWRHGGAVYAEVEVAEHAAAFGIHPALLDAALHTAALVGGDVGGLPFSWEDVRLHATGARTARVRAVLDGDALSLDLTDTEGAPIATVGSLVFRAPQGAPAAVDRALFRLDWVPVRSGAATGTERVLHPVPAAGTDPVTATHEQVAAALAAVKEWLGDDRFPGTRLVFVTRGAVHSAAPDPAAAAVWGLVRSAQAEHPGRFGLLDVDGETVPAAALASDEPQLAVRDGELFAPRLARTAPPEDAALPTWDGTVVITGGTGGLGSVLARHLVTEHGVRHLLLLSRSGVAAPGLVDELTGLGADVVVTACDVADRAALAEALSSVEHPVSAVLHAAGVLADGVISALTPAALDTALRPKVDAAWHLHELVGDADLVLFSSVAGVTGAAGQGNYAAGNAFLDALAALRRAQGLPAVSLAWGPWESDAGMTGADENSRRLRQLGTPPLTVAQGTALFDAALRTGEPVVVPVRLDLAALRAMGTVPAVLRGLVRTTTRRAAVSGSGTAADLVTRLGRLDETRRRDAVLDLVREQVGAVLGHQDPRALDPARPLAELGFDSLTAIELRNQLSAATGLRFPATLVYDHPSVAVLAAHVLDELLGTTPGATPGTSVSTVDASDPVVVVGMACRYPGGVRSPEDLWRLVSEGRDAISGFPVNRGWDLDTLFHPDPDHPGTSYTRSGGFLHDAGEFDAEFFGMSPREALATDAQQRLLLEASWSAVEHAGIDPISLRGSSTGVFAGVMYGDYGTVLAGGEFDGYVGTGSSASVASGRVSYVLGLEGPTVTVDTACSSSLVAMHWAMQSLRAGECALALAGGVTVMSTPGAFVEFSRQRGLSTDGRCKAYSDSADGVGWAEGVGVLVLERQSDALRNGHRILAVVRGSAVNSDGASNGLTAPSGPAQQRVIRQALASAGLSTTDVDVVEGHGTGTSLGDPIEAGALLQTYGQDRDTPLLLGSVKSNIGHTQAAAGVAGVIKMIMAMRHGRVPPSLYADRPSDRVDWAAGAVDLVTETTPWPETGRPRRAGVSSFGFSGTNAHTILEQPPTGEPATQPGGEPSAGQHGVVPVVLSGRTGGALRDQAARLLSVVDDHAPADLAFSLATRRSAFEQRAAVVTGDPAVLRRALGALAADRPDPALVTGEHTPGGRLAMLFTGQGAQRPGMGRDLYRRFPVFAQALDTVAAAFEQHLDRPLLDVLFADDGPLDETGWTQPALFALEVALFRQLEAWGVRPDHVAGHSIGELAAAHVAGVFPLADAAALVAARGRLMQALPDGGAMVAIAATEDEVQAALTDGVDIAAVNGPAAVVVSGDEEPVLALGARFAEDGRRTRRLAVSHAFHSARVDAVLADFRAVAEQVTYSAPAVPLVSTLTGAVVTDEVCAPDYWVEHARRTVRFADAVTTLAGLGTDTFLEIGPDGVLTGMAAETATGPGTAFAATLRADTDEETAFVTALARLHVRGIRVDWHAWFAGSGARPVDLPTYAFQHEFFWPPAPVARPATDPADDRLWAAVERDDATELASVLGIAADELGTVLPALSSWRRGRHDRARIDSWRYRVTWTPVRTGPARLSGTWLLVGPDPGLADALRSAGAEVRPVAVEGSAVEVAEHLTDDVTGVLSTVTELAAALTLLQTIPDVPLWTITGGAVTTGVHDPLTDPEQAAVWGFGRTAALEYPRRWGGLIDLPAEPDATTAERVVEVLAGRHGEDQVAIRATGVLGRRLVRHPAAPAPEPPVRGTVLVTGGTGELGAAAARWLATAGATRLVLTSRRGPDAPGAADLRAELTALGAEVDVVACDAADRDALAAVLAGLPDLTGVVHAAGTSDIRPLAETTPGDLAAAMAAKADGAAHLHALLADRDLDLFVLFGSLAGVLGSGGQAGYAAANAYLDALAEHRHGLGRAATSVAWGPWAGGGMATDDEVSRGLARRGLTALPAGPALAALRQAVASGEPALTVADVDWARYAAVFTSSRPSPLLAEVAPAQSREPVGTSELATRIAGLTDTEQERLLVGIVRDEAAAVLGHDRADGVPAQRAFREAGFDSLTAVELRTRLGGLTGLPLPATMVFDHPTPLALARYLRAELLGATTDGTAPVATRADADDPIAIVAMACRFPGDVRTPEDLWALLADGRDAITDFPAGRGWDGTVAVDTDPDRPGATYTTRGGFVHDADRFDPAFFGISPREALGMDPQQRLLLETTWECVERAGIDPTTLRGSRTGTFVGASHAQYGGEGEDIEGHVVTGTIPSILSGRLAYVFGLEGPAVTVDTACSSSLVAMHLAAQSLRDGETTLAVAGGVTVMTTPGPFVAFSRQRALAPDGRSKAFSDAADGMALAEGAGVVLLERLSDALRNGHPVLALVRGSATNSDGASNGLTAPNGLSQQRVIRQALANAHVTAADIDAVEAHGTGTALGDPIEARALQATYGRDRERPLWLGSVKSNIGHTQSAAGVASVIKMVLALRHGALPRTLHVDEPSSHVDWSSAAVTPLAEPVAWPARDVPRRAAVSSFGISGTNAHLVLEEAPAPDPVPDPPEPPAITPWVLSARTPAALRAQATRLRSTVDGVRPLDVGHTLVGSRALFEHRAVVLGRDLAELTAGLGALAAGRSAPSVVTGTADLDGRTVFVFPGQGAQWAGMGARLLAESPVFAARTAECATALAPFTDWSLTDVLTRADDAPTLERVDVVQPASFAVMVSLAAVWRSRGVRPDAVVGHSQGEIAAAVAAGALSIEDGARVVALRSKAIAETLAGAGGMMSVALPVAELTLPDGVSVAAVNGPSSTVVSGTPEGLDALQADLVAQDVRVRRVAVDYASHSAQVEALRDRLHTDLAPLRPRPADIPFLSTLTGDWLDTTAMDADYWYRNLRETVRFEHVVRELLAAGHRAFVEVSPHPVLTFAVQETADDAREPVVVAGTLRRDDGGLDRLLTSAAEVFTRGVPGTWLELAGGRRVDLPTYAFQRDSYWIPPTPPRQAEGGPDATWRAIEEADPAALAADLRVDEDALAAVLPALSAWRRDRADESTVDSWRYGVRWTPVPTDEQVTLTGVWLLATGPDDDADEVADALTAHGAEIRRLTLSGFDREQLADRLDDVAADLTGIVCVATATGPCADHPALPLGVAATVTLVQALGDAGIEAPLWCLTRGAQSTGPSDVVTEPAQAMVHGVAWTAALEHPHRVGGVVDLPGTLDTAAARRLVTALSGGTGEDQLAVRATGLLARRVVPAPAAPTAARWSPRGTTLVTGGTGTLGPHVARWLVARGAEHVVLLSRRGAAAPGMTELVAELGGNAEAVACDVTDRDALAAVRARLAADGHEVRTVIHAAAVIELAALADTDLTGFAHGLDAKVRGAHNLHEVWGDDLDTFLLFSSVAGMWGTGQHAAYVAGNAYLHALAEHRAALGMPATSLSWGIWADDLELGRVDPTRIRRSGLEFMDPARALTGLGRVLDCRDTAVAVADVDWELYHPVYTAARPTRLFDEVPSVRLLAATEAADRPDGEFATRLRALPPAEREHELLELVRTEAAAVLGHDSADALAERRAFRDAGFDSVTAVELRNRLTRATGLTLPVTMVFDHPNPVALTDFLLAGLAGATTPAGRASATAVTEDEPIAIIGMACRYPGGANTPERLWDLVRDGVDAISGFPADRGWPADTLYAEDPDSTGKTYSTQGGFLHDAAGFDPGFFGVSPREALVMDPQQRLLLETAWEVFERAGIDPHTMRGSRTGTFVGASYQDYSAAVTAAENAGENAEGHGITGSLPSVLSGRLAYLFGLEGPALTLDTACSSSLVAMHLAARSLATGESSLALAGGVSIMATPSAFVGFSRQRALAKDGRCKAYADGADGMSLAEGVGVLLLERLSDARRNGHRVLAVLRGSAVNADGASNGLTAPNGPAQQRVIADALAAAGLEPSDVDAVEGHGTGTALGDPIEAGALLQVYGQNRDIPLLLGSVKSNIGHTQMAAGVAGVIKVVKSLEHGVLPRTLHVDTPSSHVDWSAGAIELLTEETAWPDTGRPRRAGVSSFGLSGTNAHVILEQAPPADETADVADTGPVPVLVSARDEAALRATADQLLSYVDTAPNVPLQRLAGTLATTRATFEHRAALVAEDREDLVRGLTALRDGTGPVTRAGRGRTAFLFSGQGSQRLGMGRELYGRYPAFAEALDDVLAHLDPGLRDVMWGEDPALLDHTGATQPALFAVEVALFRLLASWRVQPDYLAGHSIGELAAAHVAGVLSLPDACTLVSARARLMAALPEGGAMVALRAGEDEALALLGEHLDGKRDRVALASLNGPSSVVLSGDGDVLAPLVDRLRADGYQATPLRVSHAFHSPRMDGMLADFAAVAHGLTYHPPALAVVSTVTGEPATAEVLCSPDYWVRQVREPVRFAGGVSWLADRGVGIFVELGPDGVLSGMARESAGEAVLLPALRKDRPEVTALLGALTGLHVHGGAVDWSAYFGGTHHLHLPTYPFQRARYWPAPPAAAPAAGEDAEFWTAVERTDLAALSATLDVDGDALAEVLPALAGWRARWHEDRHERTVLDGLRHRVQWRALPAPAPTPRGRWLVLCPDDVEHSWLPDLLAAIATEHVVVTLADLAALDGGFSGVLSLLAIDVTDEVAALTATAAAVRALDDAGIRARLWCLTRGGTGTDAAQAAVWGLGRVVALEQPDTWGGLADLPAEVDRHTVRRLAAVLTGGEEDQVAIRAEGAFGRRLVPDPLPVDRPSRDYRPAGTVLVTGGTGALGAHVARWLAREGAGHLLLTSRRGPGAPGAADLVAELEALGARVTVAACDAADRDAMAALLADEPLTAVFHTAGVVDDGVVTALTPDRFAEVVRAKVTAARVLHELTADLGHELAAFVLFSSMAGTIGAAGQGNYAAANAALDALARQRHAAGLPATSVAWGPWADSGMAAGDVTDRMRRGGLTPLAPDRALAALHRAIDHGDTEIMLADVDWSRFATVLSGARRAPLFTELSGVPSTRAAAPAPTAVRDERGLLDLLRSTVATVLGHTDPAAVDADRSFLDLGFDSLTSVELRNALGTATGLRLPAALIFDHPTPRALAAHLAAELSGDTPAGRTPNTTTATDEPIAIVGMGCRFPGDVSSPEDLWALLADGRDGITGFPADRGWDLAALTERSATPRGGFLSGVADFDAGFFGISPREALAMDPQQRLLLETTWEALERAGVDPVSLRGSDTGVFVGTNGQDYVTVLRKAAELADGDDADALGGYVATGNTASVLSGRLAYALGLEGPAVTVDTACSASLVSLHWAVRALRSGECSLALAGGASVMSGPDSFVEFSLQGGLAPDGRCKAFGAGADGTAWAEGVGVLVLERLSDAERDGHRVLAVVRGSAVNSDGASNGLTAPNGPSQQRVIHAALADAGLSTADVDVVEAHGTGTTLGDPIEAHALLATYGRDRETPLLLGSVKSNLGHTQGAAGVAGVMKVVLALTHDALPKTLHADEPSPEIHWQDGAVALLTEPRDWPEHGRPRRAAVSAFGISGTNAHVIVEQAPTAPVHRGVEFPVEPWVVSARGAGALDAQLDRLTAFRARRPELCRTDIARTLATSRAALPHRAVLLSSVDGVVEVARGVAADDPGCAYLFSGQGAQRIGMGRELYDRYDVFADALDELLAHLDDGLRDVLWGDDPTALERTGWAQPALFAVEVALFRLLESWGVRPGHLFGHSIGELAAAHVAGVLSVRDACALVSARARLMQSLPSGGVMVAVAASEDEVTPLLDGQVSIAAVNGPEAVVLAGAEAAVRPIADRFGAQGRRTTRLHVSHAFHSPLMDPVLVDLRAVAAGLTYHPPAIPVVSDVTGAFATTEELCSPDYWVRHAREAVRFADGITTLVAAGVRTFVELGPDGALSGMARGQLPADAVTIPLLRKDRGEETALVTALGTLHTRGLPVDWHTYFGDGPVVDLPTYAFQRTRFWPDVPAGAARAATEPVDAEFWTAVESADIDGLASTLDVDGAALADVLPALASWRRGHHERAAAESWCYRTTWTPVPVHSTELPGTWLALVPEGWTGDAWLTAAVAALHGAVLPVEALTAEVAGSYEGVVSFTGADPGELLESLSENGITGPLWCVTRGAVQVADEAPDPVRAALWGAGRVRALEHPDRWGGLIDLTDTADGLTAALTATGEDQLAVRADGVFARRLVRARTGTETWTPRGTVLVAGGTAPLVRWLTDCGAERVVVTDEADLEDLPDATAVVVTSAAGTATAARLDELTGDLDAFVVCGSIAGVWGAAGRADEAATSAYLEALALRRRARGLRATAIGWGAWEDDDQANHLRLSGLPGMAAGPALGVVGRVIASDAASTAVVDVAWDRFVPAFTATRPSPLLTGVPEAQAAAAAAERAREERRTAAEALRDRIADLPAADRPGVVLGIVRDEVAAVLGHANATAVEPDRAFSDLGFDSLAAVDLRNQLAGRTALDLPATLVFDHPTPAALADHLLELLVPGTAGPDGEEAELRALLASVPLTRLRDIGVLDALLDLAAVERHGHASDQAGTGSIDAMDVDDLVRAALNGDSGQSPD